MRHWVATAAQRRMYEAVLEHVRATGAAPRFRDLMARTGLRSTSTVHKHVTALIRLELLMREGRVLRPVRRQGECCPLCGGKVASGRSKQAGQAEAITAGGRL